MSNKQITNHKSQIASSYTPHIAETAIKQGTHYKTPDNSRAFVVVDVADYRMYRPAPPPRMQSYVVLKEFSSPLDLMEQLIKDGALISFIPKIV